jgi:hypothetical protein
VALPNTGSRDAPAVGHARNLLVAGYALDDQAENDGYERYFSCHRFESLQNILTLGFGSLLCDLSN